MEKIPDMHWISVPGWTPPSQEALFWLAERFPAHQGHLLSHEATIDLALRFWCHDCQQELVAR